MKKVALALLCLAPLGCRTTDVRSADLVDRLQMPKLAIKWHLHLTKDFDPIKEEHVQDPEAVVSECEARIDAGEDTAKDWLRLAFAYRMLDRPLDSERAFEQGSLAFEEDIEQHPNDAALLLQYSRVLLAEWTISHSRESWDKSLDALKSSWDLNRDSSEINAAVAHICAIRGQMEEAAELARRAIDLDSTNYYAFQSLAVAIMAIRMENVWHDELNEAALDEMDSLSEELLGHAESMEDPVLARAIAHQVLILALIGLLHEEDEDESEQRSTGRRKEIATEAKERILSWLEADLTAFHDRPDIEAMCLVFLWFLQGNQGGPEAERRRFERAVAAVSNAALHDFTLENLLEGRIVMQGQLGRWEEAVTTTERLGQIRDDARTWNVLGYLAWKEHEYEQARNGFRRALERDDTSAYARMGLALSLLKEDGDPAEAAAHLKRVLEEEPDSGTVFLALGIALALDGREEEAKRHIKRAVEILPDDEDVLATARDLGVAIDN